MKRIIAVLLCLIMFFALMVSPVSASEPKDMLVKRTIEILENGDVVTTEVYECAVQPRSGKNGYVTSTYVDATGRAIWMLTVTGSFTYNGVSSRATSAEASVYINNTTKAKFVSKNAYTSGATATGTATVTYLDSRTTRSASVSCDKNGNLY
ncbi:hypothetical protein AALA61_10975 [Oscillospiraceae bacterium 42-9]|jgi:hypothetical protein